MISHSHYLPRSFGRLLSLAGVFSVAALVVALIAQYGFGLHPCTLCVYQRIPYGVVLALVVLGWVAPGQRSRLALLCVLVFAVGAGIAGYHTGVEYGIFTGPTACSSSTGGEQTLEELRAAILSAPLVSCSQAMAYVFGLSIAAWNAIFSTLACLATFAGWRYVRRHHVH
jgi:disulfide bond formation protein DsbB